jgi:hypothetical protein
LTVITLIEVGARATPVLADDDGEDAEGEDGMDGDVRSFDMAKV